MKNLLLICLSVFISTPSFAKDEPLTPTSEVSSTESAIILRETYSRLTKVGTSKDQLDLLRQSILLFEESSKLEKNKKTNEAREKKSEAKAVASLFLATLDEVATNLLQQKLKKNFERSSVLYALKKNPSAVAKELSNFMYSQTDFIMEAYRFATDHKAQKDVITGAVIYYSDKRNALLSKESMRIADSISKIAKLLKNSSATSLESFIAQSNKLSPRIEEASMAIANRFEATKYYADYFEKLASDFERTKSFKPMTIALKQHLDRAHQSEEKEGVYRARVNRQTITAAATAAMTILTLGTYGLAAGATQATLQTAAKETTKQVLLKGINAGIRAATVSFSTINLVDIVLKKGAKGLLSFEGAINLLTILAAMPRPGLSAMMTSRNALQFAQLQYQAGSLSILLGGGYCIYMLSNAETLAKRDQANGGSMSSSDVRKAATSTCLASALGGLNHYAYYKQNVAKSPELSRLIKYRAGFKDILARNWNTLKNVLIIPPGIDALKNIQAIAQGSKTSPTTKTVAPIPGAASTVGKWNQPSTPLKALGGNLFSMARGVVLGLVLRFASFSTFDFTDMKASGPLPDLNRDEIAIVFNGFDTTDILYYGAENSFFISRELSKYKRNVNLFYLPALSPEDMLHKIDLYSKKYGKIKYLRIVAHGLPGTLKFMSSDAAGLESKGILNTKWLIQNSAKVRKINSKAFSDHAQIRLYSCLVGGTLQHDAKIQNADGSGYTTIDKNAATEFTQAFGRTFLMNGGELHTSRRYLIGFTAIGGFMDQLIHKNIRNPFQQGIFDQKLETVAREMETILKLNPEILQAFDFAESNLLKVTKIQREKLKATHVSERLISMYRRIIAITNEVGLNVITDADGYIPPWSTKAHRVDRFYPEN